MLSPVLLLKPQNTTTSLLFSKNSTGSKYLNEKNTKSYHSHITHFNPPNPHTYSVVHNPTTSFNSILIHSNPPPPFCHLVTEIFQPPHSRSGPASLEQTPASIATNICPILRAYSNLSPCHLFTALSLHTENTVH